MSSGLSCATPDPPPVRRACSTDGGSYAEQVTSTRARVAIAVTAVVLAGGTVPAAATRTVPTSVSAAPVTTVRAATALTREWRARAPATLVLGRSVQGRQIVAVRRGASAAPYVVLVVGQMHGSEPGGRDVVAELRRIAAPGGVQLWTITSMNPDGARAGTRRNARGVDLNRNFPHQWRPSYTNRVYYPGRRASSEPETRAMTTFLDRLRPDLIVSLHQAYRSVDVGNAKTRAWATRIARAFGLPTLTVPCRGPCSGTMTGWFNTVFTGHAVTVELPGRVSGALARAYARGTIRVAAALVPRTPAPPRPTTPAPAPPIPTPTPVAPSPEPSATAALSASPSGSPSGSTAPADTPTSDGPSATAPTP